MLNLTVNCNPAIRLAHQGHHVTLSDISSAELEVAKSNAVASGTVLAAIVVTDACHMGACPEIYRSNHFDIVLCLGPLYHLLHLPERQRILRDLTYITKPDGYLLCAFVTIFAHLRDVAKKDPSRLYRETSFYTGYLETGVYNRGVMPMHHSQLGEIKQLFADLNGRDGSGEGKARVCLTIERIVGTESFLAGKMDEQLRKLTEHEFQEWVSVSLKFAENEEIAGSADHVLVVVKKSRQVNTE
ncbi:hypothetical protein H2198_001071 [Neophaeococcomyces mojaviensis]|uniref:Uncharacterized protein n=1 Tax=Neophaeococcomyces mojaviensis TaxID=3383035 RepID=A0ACC3AIT2_9EURO|nr:hypothetical protein H2198_001071 [Knufia sp. JES_112]